jgi:transposase
VIGEDVSERAKFRIIVARHPKYAYHDRDGLIQAPALDRLHYQGA